MFLNGLTDQIELDYALKQELANLTLGQISDGSLIDTKLSNTTGQVKDRLSKVITDLANFMATKGQSSGIASLNSAGNLNHDTDKFKIGLTTGTISRLITATAEGQGQWQSFTSSV